MIREYFVVARYVAKIAEGKDYQDIVYKEVENDLTRLIKFDRQKELRDMFTIIPGEEIAEKDYENE